MGGVGQCGGAVRRRSMGFLSAGAGHHSALAGIGRFVAAIWQDVLGTIKA